jgi:hypothetical protein
MGVFNNLVMFDQHAKQNSMQSVVPDLATGWSWSEDGTQLTFPLREGVKWHDGKPFTASDVKCTWDLLTGKSTEKLRLNPRKSWYRNLAEVTTNGDYEITFHLQRPQPAFVALLASGYSVAGVHETGATSMPLMMSRLGRVRPQPELQAPHRSLGGNAQYWPACPARDASPLPSRTTVEAENLGLRSTRLRCPRSLGSGPAANRRTCRNRDKSESEHRTRYLHVECRLCSPPRTARPPLRSKPPHGGATRCVADMPGNDKRCLFGAAPRQWPGAIHSGIGQFFPSAVSS